MIAIALACRPKLLIADEPTSSLDVTIQAQVLDLIRDLKTRLGSAVLLITHDFGVVAEMADRVIVMYAGRKVEEGSVGAIFSHPRHPYTRALLQAVPRLGSATRSNAHRRLAEIPGVVPSLIGSIRGCAFAERCALATKLCRDVAPAFDTTPDGQVFACHHADEVAGVMEASASGSARPQEVFPRASRSRRLARPCCGRRRRGFCALRRRNPVDRRRERLRKVDTGAPRIAADRSQREAKCTFAAGASTSLRRRRCGRFARTCRSSSRIRSAASIRA